MRAALAALGLLVLAGCGLPAVTPTITVCATIGPAQIVLPDSACPGPGRWWTAYARDIPAGYPMVGDRLDRAVWWPGDRADAHRTYRTPNPTARKTTAPPRITSGKAATR